VDFIFEKNAIKLSAKCVFKETLVLSNEKEICDGR